MEDGDGEDKGGYQIEHGTRRSQQRLHRLFADRYLSFPAYYIHFALEKKRPILLEKGREAVDRRRAWAWSVGWLGRAAAPTTPFCTFKSAYIYEPRRGARSG